MAETKITQLTISPSIDGTEYLIVDNTEVTRRTQINSLSSIYVVNSNFNALLNTVNVISETVARLDSQISGLCAALIIPPILL